MKIFKTSFLLLVVSLSALSFARWSDDDCRALSIRLDNHYQSHGADRTFEGMLDTYDRNC